MVESALLLDELGRAAYPGPYWPTMLTAAAIVEAGTDVQKKRWLAPIATGDARATVTLLDADLDWSPDAIATRAEKTATGWQLSGVKRYVAVGPRRQRPADPGANAGGRGPVPGRSGRLGSAAGRPS